VFTQSVKHRFLEKPSRPHKIYVFEKIDFSMFHVKHFVHTKLFHKNVYNVSRETIVSKNRLNFLFFGKKVLFIMFAMFHVKHLHQNVKQKCFTGLYQMFHVKHLIRCP